MKPSQLAAALPRLLKSNHSPFIWGDPGVGKSEIIAQVAKDLKIDFVDVRLSIFDPTDLKGYPVIRGTGKTQAMHFVQASIWPTKGKGIILLDELPQAAPAVQAAAYQLVLDKKMGEYQLPEGWKVIAAGNHASNGGLHYALPAALANRFIHLELKADQPDWDNWASANGISDITRAFLRFRPGLMHDIEVRKSGMAFPSPRSWVFADSICGQGHSTSEELELLNGTIGEGPAVEFLAFIKTAKELPSVNEVLMSPDTAPVPKSPGAKHAIATVLESNASATNFKQCMTYISRLEPEYQAAFIHNISRNKRELSSTKEYIDWCIANKEMLGLS